MEFNLSPSLGKTPVGNELLKSMACGFAETFFLLINSLHCSQQSKTAMRFGDLPVWATELANLVREVVHFSDYVSEFVDIAASDDGKNAYLFPSKLLWREPLFDQLIINLYQPGEGICAHVDLMRFEDGIAIVSLESSCVMHFSRVESDAGIIRKESEGDPHKAKIPVFLTPGSLVLMWGEARYLWKHEINRKPGFQKWEGKDIDQKRRTSITLRKLCHSE